MPRLIPDRWSLAIAGLAALAPHATLASPPFIAGEVAVYATPDQLPGEQVRKYLPNAGISVVAVASGQEWGLVQKLRAQGRRAGLNLIATASATPNDPLYGYQWHMDRIQAPQAWDLPGGDGLGVTVAVLDTGLAGGGQDTPSCVVPGRDTVNNDNDPADGDGHGTHVSGTIAQATNNVTGVAGVAHGSCIMPVKVLGDDGSGSFADIADGIYHAVDNGALVINMSLGTNARYGITNDPVMDPALDYAYANGVTVVAAAGNDGNRRNVSYPAAYPSVIAVGATDLRDQLAPYSNRGRLLDMVAPGGDTSRDDNGDQYGDGVLQETRYNGAWGYYFFQGTSMASPHVAGAAAALIASGVATSPDDVRDRLTATAKDLGDPGVDKTYGHGLLQLHDALSGNVGNPPPGPGCTDADGDGVCAELDCDDTDPKVFPGANDTRGRAGRDGIDNDCDGIIDG